MKKEYESSSGADKVEAIARGEKEKRGEAEDRREEAGQELTRLEEEKRREAAAAAVRVAAAQERRAAKEEKQAAKEEKQAAKEEKRAAKEERRRRQPGFGGWLAAVVSLGVSTLVLATIVTAGAFNMRDMNAVASAGYRSSFYELTGLMDEMETDLSKLRVSSTAAGQRNLATDLLVNSSLAAGALVTVFAALIAFNSYYRFDDDELVSVIGFFVDRADYETADAIFVNNESKEIFLRYTPEGKAPVTVRFNISPARSAELLALLEKKCAFARVEFFDPPAKKQPPEKK